MRLAVGLLLLAAVLWKASARKVLASLAAMDVRLFLAAVLLYGLCQLASSLRWQLLLSALKLRVGLARLFGLYLVGMFFNQVLPGSISGDLVKAGALHLETGRTVEVATSVLLDRLFGLGALLVLGALGLAAAPPASVRVQAALWLAGVLFVGLLAFLRRALRRTERFRRVLEAIDAVSLRSAEVRRAAGVSVVVQAGNVAVYLLLARALGLALPLPLVLGFYLAVTLAAALPLSLGGLGVREWTGTAVFAQASLGSDAAVSLALSWTLAVTLWSLCGGALFALSGWRRRPPASPTPA